MNNIILVCGLDGRIRVFFNEKYDNKINEEDEFEDIEDNNCSIDDSDDEVEEINVNKNLNV